MGDVTGILAFTHAGSYQARVASADMLGNDVTADYSAIPRVAFTDPEVATVGLSAGEAREQGIDIAVSRLDPRARPLDRSPTRRTRATRSSRSWPTASAASSSVRRPSRRSRASSSTRRAMAIKLRATIDALRDTVSQFPTFSEGFSEAVRKLEL